MGFYSIYNMHSLCIFFGSYTSIQKNQDTLLGLYIVFIAFFCEFFTSGLISGLFAISIYTQKWLGYGNFPSIAKTKKTVCILGTSVTA